MKTKVLVYQNPPPSVASGLVGYFAFDYINYIEPSINFDSSRYKNSNRYQDQKKNSAKNSFEKLFELFMLKTIKYFLEKVLLI